MKTKKFIIIGIVYLAIIFTLNYAFYTIPLMSSDGIGEWSGTAEDMEQSVTGPSFIVDHYGEMTWQIIWVVVLSLPGIIICYKFYKNIKLRTKTT